MDSGDSEAVVIYSDPVVLSPENIFTERFNTYFTGPRYLGSEVIE